MTEQLELIEIYAYNNVTREPETLRFCTGRAYRTRPSETPPNALFRPYLFDPGWTRIDVWTRPGQYGHVTQGETVIDGILSNDLVNYSFDGRRIVKYSGLRDAVFPDEFVVMFDGAIDGAPSFSWDKIVLRPSDATIALKRPLQHERYLGNNVLPDGIEGGADLAGKVKPIVFANASNMSPVLVNTAKLIYQSSVSVSNSLYNISINGLEVRDKGVPLNFESYYASLQDMYDDTQQPSAGGFKLLYDAELGFFFRLGSSPVGQVTHDVALGFDAYGVNTHAQAWKRLLIYAGIDVANISANGGNEILYSEAFSNAIWTKTNTTINTGLTPAPAGLSHADGLIESIVTGAHSVAQAGAILLGVECSITLYVRTVAIGSTRNIQIGGTNDSVIFDIGGNVIQENGLALEIPPTSFSPFPIYRRLAVHLPAGHSSAGPLVISLIDGTAVSYAGDGTSGLLIAGAQINYLPSFSDYQQTTNSRIEIGDIALLDILMPGEIECAFFNDVDFFTELTRIAASAGCSWYGDENGIFRLKQWTIPSGVPIENLSYLRTESIDITDAVGNGEIAPAYLITTQYGKNWTVQQDANLGGDKTSPSDIVEGGGLVGLPARAWLYADYRPLQVSDMSIKRSHQNAVELKFVSMFKNAADALAFSAYQLKMFKKMRPLSIVNLKLTETQINTVRAGSVIKLTEQRFGFSSGKLMRVAGVKIDRETGKTELSLWGNETPNTVIQPFILSPFYSQTDLGETPTISSSEFEVVNNGDTHVSSDWQISTTPNGGNVVWDSIADTTNKTSIVVSSSILVENATYYLRVRYTGAIYGTSEWSLDVMFNTIEEFPPTVIGQAYGGGFYAGQIDIGGNTYNLIDAPKSSEVTLQYKTTGTPDSGPTSVNNGLLNTNTINNATHPAAQYCRSLSIGGKTDWYLPSRDELEVSYRNLKPTITSNTHNTDRGDGIATGVNSNSIPTGIAYTSGNPAQTSLSAFQASSGAEYFNGSYWASTEYAPNTNCAWSQNFTTGAQGIDDLVQKNSTRIVRAMRKVLVV